MLLTLLRAAGRPAAGVAVLLASACAADQNPALPFTGTRSFNFEDSAGSERVIRIDAKGHVTVTLVGRDASVTLYEGPYQNPLPVPGEVDGAAYYRIDDARTISLLDENRQLKTGCQMGPNHPCQSGLYPAD